MIGIGSEFRGDDAAGLEVARRLRRVNSATCIDGSLDMINLWDGWSDVALVDATRSGSAPGTIQRFDGKKTDFPSSAFVSTHAIGTGEAIRLAREMGLLPDKLTVYGIEAGSFAIGAPLTPSVAGAVDVLVEELDNA